MPQFKPNPFYQLYATTRAEAQRPYNGRGILLKRCERCQLSKVHCICKQIVPADAKLDFVLIYHRDEVFKPTNSGRLVGEAFPNQSHFYVWDRTEPANDLLELLNSPSRDCYLLFPEERTKPEENHPNKTVSQLPAPQTEKVVTLIVLDGTWRQARRMFNRSPWLKQLPTLSLTPSQITEYGTREAAHEHYLSTAESVALALNGDHYASEAKALAQIFREFNQNYLRMKRNLPPTSATANI